MGWKSCYIIATAKDCRRGISARCLLTTRFALVKLSRNLVTASRIEDLVLSLTIQVKNVVTIGAYEKAVIITDQVVYDCFDDRDHPFFKQALSIFPDGTLCMIIFAQRRKSIWICIV